MTSDLPRTTIEEADVIDLGRVDEVLGDFYADQIRSVANRSGVSEHELRAWFDSKLITEQGFRTQVPEGEGPAGAGPDVMRMLVDSHLIRAETRRDQRWYELSHDRLVEPIRLSNALWAESNLHPFQKQAREWDKEKRPEGLLIDKDLLAQALLWSSSHPGALQDVDHQYLDACEKRRDREALAHRRRNQLIVGLAAAVVVVSLVGVLGFVNWRRAVGAETDARAAKEDALTQKGIAETQQQIAEESAKQAEAQRLVAEQNATEAETQRRMAEESAKEADAQRLAAEQNATAADQQRAIAEANAREADRQRVLAQRSSAEAQRIAAATRALCQDELRVRDERVFSLCRSAVGVVTVDCNFVWDDWINYFLDPGWAAEDCGFYENENGWNRP